MKWSQILPELFALIGGMIVFILCIFFRKSGEYTFFATFIISIILFVGGYFIKILLQDGEQ